MKNFLVSLCLATSVAGLSACVAPVSPSCPAGMGAMHSESLYFGTAGPNGSVTPEQWTAFLAETVTPRFPQGLTVLPGSGQWRSGAGEIEHEASYVVNIVHAGTATEDSLFDEVVAAYKNRFQQESVLRVRSDVCVSFRSRCHSGPYTACRYFPGVVIVPPRVILPTYPAGNPHPSHWSIHHELQRQLSLRSNFV